MRLALDTNVVVAAMRSPRGASSEILRRIDDGRHKLALTVPLALEYEAVCMRPEHRKAAGLSEAETAIFVDGVIAIAEPVEVRLLWRPLLRDPGDDMVLEAAVNGRADALISFNRRDFGAAPSRFGVRLLTPGDFLRSMDI